MKKNIHLLLMGLLYTCILLLFNLFVDNSNFYNTNQSNSNSQITWGNPNPLPPFPVPPPDDDR